MTWKKTPPIKSCVTVGITNVSLSSIVEVEVVEDTVRKSTLISRLTLYTLYTQTQHIYNSLLTNCRQKEICPCLFTWLSCGKAFSVVSGCGLASAFKWSSKCLCVWDQILEFKITTMLVSVIVCSYRELFKNLSKTLN